jgi:hypothetical protein
VDIYTPVVDIYTPVVDIYTPAKDICIGGYIHPCGGYPCGGDINPVVDIYTPDIYTL